MYRLINKLIDHLGLHVPHFQDRDLVRNTFALTALEKLISPGIFFPISTPSLEAFSILQVVNDIMINNKKCVVEIGSGLSTVILCRLKKMNNLSFQFYAIESNQDWLEIIQKQLEAEGLAEMVTLIYAPLEECFLGYKPESQWFSISVLDAHFGSESKVDLVLVDGPPAHEQGNRFSRFPAFDYFQKLLATSYSFYLDDINRKGERQIMKAWSTTAGIKPLIISPTFGVLAKDLAFFPFMM